MTVRWLGVECEVSRDAIAHLAREVLPELDGDTRGVVKELLARAAGQLAFAEERDGPDELSRAAAVLGRAAHVIRQCPDPTLAAFATRADSLAQMIEALREQHLERLETGFSPVDSDNRPPAELLASVGAPRLHRLPTAHPPLIDVRPLAPIPNEPSIRRAIEETRRNAERVASRLIGVGSEVFDELLEGAPSVRRDLIRLTSRPVTEETPGRRGQQAMLERIARGLFEEIGVSGQLRMRRAGELFPPQVLGIEGRLLASLDAAVALGASGPVTIDILVVLAAWASDSPARDPFRPFASALILGCIDDPIAAEAAVSRFRAAPPDTWAMVAPALILGSSTHLDDALARAIVDAPSELLPHLLDVMTARRRVSASHIFALTHHTSPLVRRAVAASLGTAAPASLAQELSSRLLEDMDDEIVAEALSSLVFLDLRRARREIRDRLDADSQRDGLLSRRARRRMVQLLSVAGERSDLERLLRGLERHPGDAAWMGAFGHLGLVPRLVELLESHNAGVRLGAETALRHISGVDIAEDMPPDTRRRRCLEWWEDPGRNSDDRIRHRRGRPCTVQWLATVLLEQSMTTMERAWALDELSLAVGRPMPDSRDWLARAQEAIRAAGRTSGRLAASGWLTAS